MPEVTSPRTADRVQYVESVSEIAESKIKVEIKVGQLGK
jgi:hypothetical protein